MKTKYPTVYVFDTALEASYCFEKDLIKLKEQGVPCVVDKDELLKALKYDRNQYRIGFEDAEKRYTHIMLNMVMEISAILESYTQKLKEVDEYERE